MAAYGAYGAGSAPAENLRVKIAEQVTTFNSTLMRLTNDLVARYPQDPQIARAQRRISLAIGGIPLTIMDIVGPYLWKYRAEICNGEEEFFLKNSYDSELSESEDSEKADIAAYIIPKVKDAWKEADPAEKKAYTETVQNLLDAYTEYLVLKIEEN